jgi:hypothetical protein
MLGKILLFALATTLAGCATGYSYRNGAGGDYYYGQPHVEYRYYGSPGFYGSFGYGGYAGYARDRYGWQVYGHPYPGYGYPFGYPFGYGYGYPNGYGSPWWHRPRTLHDGSDAHHGPDANDAGAAQMPPWRNLGGVLPQRAGGVPDHDGTRPRPRRQQTPSHLPMPAPQQQQRALAPSPRMFGDDGGRAHMGRATRKARVPAVAEE